ncbi:MAG: ABC transporter ATP-binding protein [Candidatus Saccharimonas sp.]
MVDVPKDKIQAYIDLFDGDVVQAVRALREVAYERPAVASKPRRELSNEVVIRVENLKKTYKIGKQHVDALNGVTLDIHKGEFLALTGASGSGKSTLLQLIGGLDRPSEGSVTIQDTKLSSFSDKKLSEFRNRTIGFVFQFFYLQPFLRLRQNLEVAGIPARTMRPQRRERVKQLAAVVGLGDRLEHYPKELSGGQMQRAAIARALLNNPKVILADEPTGNLDSENGQAVIELFEKIRDEFHTSIVIVTHDPAVASRADRVITLKDGVII